MSLWRTEPVRAYFGPSEVALVRPGRNPDGPAAAAPVATGGGWKESIGTLERMLAAREFGPGTACIVLGGTFASALMLPWQDQLLVREDRERYARHLYQKAFEEDSARMSLVLGSGAFGQPVPAFFASAEMLAALQATFAARGLRLPLIAPVLTAAFNRFRLQMASADTCVLAVTEVDHMHLAMIKDGAWAVVRSRRIGAQGGELALVLRREISTLPALPTHLYLVEHTSTDAIGELPGIRTTRLRMARQAAPGLALLH